MHDLRKAIEQVLKNADVLEGDAGPYIEMDYEPMRLLQAEYNIHFVELEQEQLDVL